MGWREFIRIVYEREGSYQRTKNFWGFERKIPKSLWLGKTGILPVDNVIQKLLQTVYSHHIERLKQDMMSVSCVKCRISYINLVI